MGLNFIQGLTSVELKSMQILPLISLAAGSGLKAYMYLGPDSKFSEGNESLSTDISELCFRTAV